MSVLPDPTNLREAVMLAEGLHDRVHRLEAERDRLRGAIREFWNFFENDLMMTDPGDGTTGSQMDAPNSIALDEHAERLGRALEGSEE